MSDYIKREDAIFIALQQPFFQNSMATEIRQIKGIDIVPCKECAKWLGSSGICMWDKSTSLFTKADDFCSYGERKSDE